MLLNPGDGLLGFGAVVVALALTGGLVVALVRGEPAETLTGLAVQDLVFLVVPLAIVAGRIARPWRAFGFERFPLSDIKLVFAGLGAQIAISAAFTLIFFTPEQDTLIEDAEFNETTLSVIVTVFLIVVAAPITEETLFRGLIFGALRKSAPFWVAAVASGVIFGAVHLTSGDLAVAGILTVFGVILAWLYERTGSLGPPILLHMINNSLAVALLLS
jgi:uncharacterized protein